MALAFGREKSRAEVRELLIAARAVQDVSRQPPVKLFKDRALDI
jgi:hypothetical protein